MSRAALLAVAASVLLAVAATAAEPFHLSSADTEESVHTKVRALAHEKLGPGFGEAEVTAFLEEVETALLRLENQLAVADALGLARLLAATRREVSIVLSEVISDYESRIVRITALTAELQQTLTDLNQIHARATDAADRALASVQIAQQASDTLADVLETYREVIETQSTLLRSGLPSSPRNRLSVSILPGVAWGNSATAPTTPSAALGFLLGFPVMGNLRVGLGVMTSFPARGSVLFAEIAYSP